MTSNTQALDALKSAADIALEAPILSVMDKDLTPPSGDKHDYMSLGPYWWPDPDKPDGLPYIRRDGYHNPDAQSDATDRPPLRRMCAHIQTLLLAWEAFNDNRYGQKIRDFIHTWFIAPETRMNPHLKYGQAIPGLVEGRGIGLIDTHYVNHITDNMHRIQQLPHWTEEDHSTLKTWLDKFLDWMLTSQHGKDEADTRNNHGTWYDVQVASFALAIGKTDITKSCLAQSYEKRVVAHIEADGSQPYELERTMALSYSTMNLEGLCLLARYGEPLGIDLWRRDDKDPPLKRAINFLAPYADESTPWPYEQINDFKRDNLYKLFAMGYQAYGDESFLAAIKALPDSSHRHPDRLIYPVSC